MRCPVYRRKRLPERGPAEVHTSTGAKKNEETATIIRPPSPEIKFTARRIAPSNTEVCNGAPEH